MHAVEKTVRIAIAGGNYAGLNALKGLYLNLLATNADYDGTKQAPPNPNIKITLVDRRDGFVHYLGLTRGITQPEYGSKLWLPYKDMPWVQHPSITVKKGIVSRITPTHIELADKETVEFDYLVIALGQSRNAPIGVSSSTKEEYLDAMDAYQKSVKTAESIVVVGGGAVGSELVADIKTDYPDKDVTLVHSRDLPVAGPFKDEFRHHVVDVFRLLGVSTIFGERVVEETAETTVVGSPANPKHAALLPELMDSVKRNVTLTTSSGRIIKADLAFNTLGVKTKAALVDLPSSTDTPVFSSNGIRVTGTMQIDDPQYQHIFAVGDVSNKDVVKLAGAAASAGMLAGANVAKLVMASGAEPIELDVAGRGGKGGKGGKKGKGGPSEYGRMKLVLGEHNAVIQNGTEVIAPEEAKSMVAPDIKLGKATKSMFISTYPRRKDVK
ncbi:hypothetical protein GGI07_002072 [Coemansia sp. Benny D115]|nr:hypothetical protein GGI07_002072 [Coemansia sp. Benny D115]